MKKFSEKDPIEKVLLTFDFSKLIPLSTEAISTATCDVVETTGIDLSPSAMVEGVARISQKNVSQLISGGLNGGLYTVSCVVDTSEGQRFKVIGQLPVKVQS